MADRILAPELIAPLPVDGVDYYGPGGLPDPQMLASAGFFVPGYLEQPNADWVVSLPHVEVVQLLTIGYDYAIAHVRPGVTLCNAAGVHEQSTAELAVGMIIARWRGVDRAARDMESGTWDHRRGRSLQDARVVIVGAGGVASRIADSLAPFGCSTQLVGRTARAGVASADQLPSLVAEADVVVLAVPLTPQTEGMVDQAFVKRMRDGALLVNVARGSVVVTDALLAELPRIEAALDVVDPEPLPAEHPLWHAPGVLITPHIGGDSDAFPRLARRLIVDQVRRWRGGEPLVNVIVGS